MAVPDVTEFDVYLDIDGAVEEEEDTVQSEENTPVCDLPLDSGEQSGQLSWKTCVNGGNSESTSNTGSTGPREKKKCATSGSGPSTHGHDSDNEEVDVDTPFDGKLFGQTQVKSEPSTQTLLSTLLSYTTMSTSFSGIHKGPAILKKSAVAKKSTTPKTKKSMFVQKEHRPSDQNIPHCSSDLKQKVIKTVSNVAKKSTSKQLQNAAHNFNTKNKPCKPKTGSVLQVKFGPGKYLAKAASQASFKNSSVSRAHSVMKKPVSVPKKVVQGVAETLSVSHTNPLTLSTSTSQGGKKMFPCFEKSGDRIACPECSVVVKTYCLRSHLKTVHNLPMKNCKKCKITFTDLNLYSEHYAHHLQEQEDKLSLGIQTSPKVKATTVSKAEECYQTQVLEETRKPAISKEHSASTTYKDSSDLSMLLNRVPAVSNEKDFSPLPRPFQKGSTMMKRKLPSSSSGPSPKLHRLANEAQSVTGNIAIPFHSKLPPKPQKPGFYPKKKSSSFLVTKKSVSEFVEETADRQSEMSGLVALKRKLPLKPRKPFSSAKMRLLYSSAGKDNKVLHSKTAVSGSARKKTNTSLHLEEVSVSRPSEMTRTASILHQDNRKTANRRPASMSSPQDLPPQKKPSPVVDAAAPVTKKYCGKATVSLVSLETASRPYDCKKCLGAFHLALLCPRSFRLHSQNKSYTCTDCQATFTQRRQLEVHQDTQCSVCPPKSDPDDDASFHTSLRNLRTSSASPAKELVQNVPAKSPGSGGLFECRKCKEAFQYRSLLLRHIPYHSYQYSCGICRKSYVRKVDLLDHLQIMHDGRMLLRCKYCEQKFEDGSEFDRHILMHKDGTVVACTVCSTKFSSSRQMQEHMAVSHGVSAQHYIVCQVCGKRFNKAKLLSIHMRVAHKTAVPGSDCQVCGRSFKQPRHLSIHMKLAHKTDKPMATEFLSCRFCRKVFHSKQGLATHNKLVHGVPLAAALSVERENKKIRSAVASPSNPPVSTSLAKAATAANPVKTSSPVLDINSTKCHICGKKYSKRKVLVSHYRHFHKIDPSGTKSNSLKCQICGKVVFSLQGLKVHYKVRHRRRIPKVAAPCEVPRPIPTTSLKGRFRCGKCAKFFLYSWSLYRHQRLYHMNTAKVTMKAKSNPPTQVQGKKHDMIVKPSPKNPISFEKKKPWKCHVCGKAFVLRKTMRMHVKSEHPKDFDDQRFGGRKCPKCRKAFGSRAKLRIHAQTCGLVPKFPKLSIWTSSKKKGKFKCTMCEKVFRWKQSLIRHMQKHHKLSKEVILYNLSHQKLAQSEESGSSESKFYLCDICKVCFTVKRSLLRHRQRRHGGKPGNYQCRRRACKRTFANNDSLLHHIRTFHPEMSIYWCKGCSCGFETSGDLISHRCSIMKKSHSSALNTQHDGIDYTQEDTSSSLSTEQELRYRCMTCDMGFHMAREWTKHMQKHNKNIGESATQQEQVMETKDKVRLSIFDVMSGSIIACKFCKTVFRDEKEMNLHKCEQPPATNTVPKKTKKKRKNRNLEPVKCTVCLKLFSPLSIKKHMKNIHLLPMRICNKCNIVFTDLERFSRHTQYHRQLEGGVQEIALAASGDDEPSEDSVTYFICQVCGGLFSDSESLATHACTGENDYEMAVNQDESDIEQHVNTWEDPSGKSEESDTNVTQYLKWVSQSPENTVMYASSNTGTEEVQENQTIQTLSEEGDHAFQENQTIQTLSEEESDCAFQTQIVIENVSSGAPGHSMFDSEFGGTVVDTDSAMVLEKESVSSSQLVTSYGMSLENELSHNAVDTLVMAPELPESQPSDTSLGEITTTSGCEKLLQSETNMSERGLSTNGSPEIMCIITGLETADAVNGFPCVEKVDPETTNVDAETESSHVGKENKDITHITFSGLYGEANSEMQKTGQGAETDHETIHTHFQAGKSADYEETETSKTNPFEAKNIESETSQMAQCEEAAVVALDKICESASTAQYAEAQNFLQGMIGAENVAEDGSCGQYDTVQRLQNTGNDYQENVDQSEDYHRLDTMPVEER